jgi:hypothetical protein
MALINIDYFNHKVNIGSSVEIKFYVKNSEDTHNFPNFIKDKYKNQKKNCNVVEFLGEGSYGIVFKIKIDDNYYAIKISENEIPYKLIQRYKSLCQNEKLKKHIIKIYSCGMIKKSKGNYNYYCIMEYGGTTLKSFINNENLNSSEVKLIIKQLYNIVHQSRKYRLLITDFKSGNLTISNKYMIKLIDLYMDCEKYSPCANCRIVKTYSTVELDKEKRIYEKKNYNYTGIYIPFAICLIDIICENSLGHYTNKISKKYNVNFTVKQLVPVLQIACYNYNNSNGNSIKKYKNMEIFKKSIDNQYSFAKSGEIFEYFLNLLEPKKNYLDFISKEKFNIIINNIFTIDPDQRNLTHLKEKLMS